MKNLHDFLYDFLNNSQNLLLQSESFYGGYKNSLAGVAVSNG